jgi:hypothetical protein
MLGRCFAFSIPARGHKGTLVTHFLLNSQNNKSASLYDKHTKTNSPASPQLFEPFGKLQTGDLFF